MLDEQFFVLSSHSWISAWRQLHFFAKLLLQLFLPSFSVRVYYTVFKQLPAVFFLVRKELCKGLSRQKWPLIASYKPAELHTHIYTYTSTLSVTRWAQWEVLAKRAAIVCMRVLVFSQEIYSCLKQPAPFLLNHYTMDMLIWSSTWDKRSKMGFLLSVVIWLWTVLHTEVMISQSPGISPMCTSSGTCF